MNLLRQQMLEVLLESGVIAGPYRENTDWVRALKPKLFEHNPPLFMTYRLNEERLRKLLENLDVA